MKKDTVKNILIIILFLIVIAGLAMYFLNPRYSTETSNVLHNYCEAQVKLSEYIGKLRSDMFDAYTTEQLLVGSYNLEDIPNSLIMNNSGDELTAIVHSNPEDKFEKDEVTYYRINVTEFARMFEMQLLNDSAISWYVSETGIIKIHLNIIPDWWIEEFDVLRVKR